jgi:predicted DNA binding protein
MKGNVDILINLLETQFEYKIDSEWYKHLSNELINDIKFGIKNYMDNKMDNVSDCIIELISNLITKFDNLEECNIIFDGKPFVAKMIEQIKRRAPDSIVTDIFRMLFQEFVEKYR